MCAFKDRFIQQTSPSSLHCKYPSFVILDHIFLINCFFCVHFHIKHSELADHTELTNLDPTNSTGNGRGLPAPTKSVPFSGFNLYNVFDSRTSLVFYGMGAG